MKILKTLFIIVVFFFGCNKDSNEPIDEKINHPMEYSFLRFTMNNTNQNFDNLMSTGSLATIFILNSHLNIEDDTLKISFPFIYEDSLFYDNQDIYLSFVKYYKANTLETYNVYINQGVTSVEYEITMNETLEAFHVGQYRNVLKSNIVSGKDYIKLIYRMNVNLSYEYYFSNDFLEEPANEFYFEIQNIELHDDCSFIVRGIFSGDENSLILNDSTRVTNGNFEGFYYNFTNSLCN